MTETPPTEQPDETTEWPEPAEEPDEEPAETLDDDGTPGTGTEPTPEQSDQEEQPDHEGA